MQFSMFIMPRGLVPNRHLLTTECAPSAPISQRQRTVRPSDIDTSYPPSVSDTEDTSPRTNSASVRPLISASTAGRSMILPLTGTSTDVPRTVEMRMASTLAVSEDGIHPTLRRARSLTASPHMEW